MQMAKPKGPRFVQHFGSLLDALRALGSSARPAEAMEWIYKNRSIPQSYAETVNKSGQTSFENDVHWARFYLAKAGLIDTEKRGVWVATDAGREATLTSDQAYDLYKKIHGGFQKDAIGSSATKLPLALPEEQNTSAPDEHEFINQDLVQERLVVLLKGLTDSGFEELCARLLRHIGFENVTVTGRSNDKGVDGVGYLLINRFVRTKVMFQCKRYDGVVGPEKIRDFRGAIQGRAERGILLTTGTFTRGAVEEAARENATAIELVDIDRLLTLLIEEGLGVRETKALVVEEEFFRPYSAVAKAF